LALIALVTLLHVLVLVYWLGGDLGAFYTSRYLTRPGVPADRRLMAAGIVANVDMAPRTALIAALPTGLALAEVKGWLSLGWPLVGAIAIVAAVWLGIAWRLHLRHGAAGRGLVLFDLGLRILLIAAAVLWAMAGLLGMVALPLFIAIKLLALAACVLLGLAIRRVLKPLGPALAGLGGDDVTTAEAQLRTTLGRARPLVLCIWGLLLIAAFLGLWTPTSFSTA
jgi:hypothetical protein